MIAGPSWPPPPLRGAVRAVFRYRLGFVFGQHHNMMGVLNKSMGQRRGINTVVGFGG